MDGPISFFYQDVDFEMPEEELVAEWIEQMITKHRHRVGEVSYIFCSDPYLLKMNRDHLGHDYYTDIITFPLAPEDTDIVSADIFISVDRVRDNALLFSSNIIDELHRVMIHGILHIIGYDDHDDDEKARMRKAEDFALSLRMF